MTFENGISLSIFYGQKKEQTMENFYRIQKGLCLFILTIGGIFFLCLSSASLAADEGGHLTITYCNGKNQVVRLDQPVSSIKSFEFSCEKTGSGSTPGLFGGAGYTPGALKGSIYFLPSNTTRLPDFDSMTPVGTIYSKQLDIKSQPFDQGFPGVTDRFEWFGIRYVGKFQVASAGNYKFRLYSDDGSRLYIDGQLVIDNDGVHPPRNVSGTISLSPGNHTIRVDYFQGPRTHLALQLFMTPPSGTEQLFTAGQ